MIIITIIAFICLAFVTWAVVNYISEAHDRENNRMLMIIPLLVVLVCTILAHLSVIRLHAKVDALENNKQIEKYEQVTEKFYRKIE